MTHQAPSKLSGLGALLDENKAHPEAKAAYDLFAQAIRKEVKPSQNDPTTAL